MRRIICCCVVSIVFFIPIFFTGCATHVDTVNKASPGRMSLASVEPDRLYVMKAWQRVEVKEIVTAVEQVEAIIQKSGGYIQSQSVREDDQADLALRVPADQVHSTLDALAALGEEEHRSLSTEDVTEKYIDTEARLKNAIALRDRLKALLSQAKDVKDILEIEKELTRVQSEIDSTEGRLKTLKSQVDHAEINLTLRRRKILGPLGYIFYGIGWFIQKLFVIQ